MNFLALPKRKKCLYWQKMSSLDLLMRSTNVTNEAFKDRKEGEQVKGGATM